MGQYNKPLFRKLVLLSLAFNLSWGIVAFFLEKLARHDRGFITGFGFLIIYTVPFFICLPVQKRRIYTLLYLVLTACLIFCLSTFVVGGIMVNFGAEWMALATSTVFSAICLILLMRTLYTNLPLAKTVVLFCAAAGIAMIIGFAFKNSDDVFAWQYGISIFYFLWQWFTSLVMAYSIAKADVMQAGDKGYA